MLKMQTNNAVRVKFRDSKKLIFSSQPFTFQTFLECVAKKFDLPTINVKVFDVSKTEVDEEAFEYLLTQPNLGVPEIIIPGTASLDGWDSDMSSILMLVHLLPPSSGKRPGKISVRQACDRLVKFIKTSTSIQGHLDSIGESLQPYLIAVGPNRSRIQSWFIIIDKHALPCKASNSLACVDELFQAHFVFGTSYCQELICLLCHIVSFNSSSSRL